MSLHDNDRPDDDEPPLPVIAIDNLRAIVRPDQIRNRNEHVHGLQVGGPSLEYAQLFEIDEQDPLLQQVEQNLERVIPEQQERILRNNSDEGVNQHEPCNRVIYISCCCFRFVLVHSLITVIP